VAHTLMAMTFATVRTIGRRLPEVEESTMYGAPALKLKGRMLACIASHKSAEPKTLVVRTTFDERDLLIAEQPDTYYVKDHYLTFPVVLVRLARVNPDAMRDLLNAAFRIVRAEKQQRPLPLRRPTV
ncbi:MAG: MmcQ/YjbR family DNA-binding protein, partial [Vicinamibacterales bacterium]